MNETPDATTTTATTATAAPSTAPSTASSSRGPLRLAVIVGSTRKGRFAPVPAAWFAARAREHGGFEVDIVDLAEERLPDTLVDDERSIPEPVARLAPRLAAADAFVVVTPEYNHSFPAPLKTAIDWFYTEWQAKPVGFVSYGGVSGGLRSVEHLRGVFNEVYAIPTRDTVCFPNYQDAFGTDGQLLTPDRPNDAAKVMLDRLAWLGHALRNHRADHPFAS
ncbi:NADPH-dependent FMN reductase [Streptomyces johnsoniae]|uniref:NAD(P)H-dependent oxidoreductase n=1 Tax=Streptomyces johnsoniae TaxID=3075532 RepID=A0ABU2SFQ1_9ACTN|nr:NAD(P)H-dependent oxidoreductase [Streptomyces sp. DSM 41886]MDT0446915.1 NAD(P)H-dependent oxidoreductase [Streptomyces sp. DSM 41886]